MKTVFVILIVFVSTQILPQVTQQWVSRFSSPGNHTDISQAMVLDNAGNVYVTGYTYGANGTYDYITLKYNSSGALLWERTYDGPAHGNDRSVGIGVDLSGNVIVSGFSDAAGSGSDWATIKYNSSGNLMWVDRFNNAYPGQNNIVTAIAVDEIGNSYVAGKMYNGINYEDDFAVIKYNTSGLIQWGYINSSGMVHMPDQANAITIDASYVYATGYFTTNTGKDYATIKLNKTSGNALWGTNTPQYNGAANSDDVATSIAVHGGAVYVTGYSMGTGTGNDYATIKYNASGVQQFVLRYDGPGHWYDVPYSIAVGNSGRIYVTGVSTGVNTGYDYATIQYNSTSAQEWVSRYSGQNSDIAGSVSVDASGNVYVTGSSFYTDINCLTIKYRPSGEMEWYRSFDGPGHGTDVGYSVIVDAGGNVHVMGGSTGNGTGYDFATIKYSQGVGIQQISNEVPEKYELVQNYPNPFNPETVIRYSIMENGFTSLKVYDILGNEIKNLVNEVQRPGVYEVKFDGKNLSSGTYYYRIESGSFAFVKKMMLVK